MPIDPPLLTPLHRDLLDAAARRGDLRLTPPERVMGSARKRLGEKLVAIGVAEVVLGGEPAWVCTPSGEAAGLKLTATGVSISDVGAGAKSDGRSGQELASALVEPRPSTKIATVLDLLRQPEGADMQTLTATTGWLPHTTRAALTGLRRKGHVIATRKREGDGKTIYCIVPASDPTRRIAEATPATSQAAPIAPVVES